MLETIGLFTHVVGELLVAYTVLMVHHRVLNQHKIDRKVFATMRSEQRIGILGVLLILTGFIIQIVS
ncbi:MAG: hypothetical protein Q8P30_01415 [Candidatus Uhrbacteria bacterium]|nr:hypothetical protein [Candidatus Uhrbacteria bacterium]